MRKIISFLFLLFITSVYGQKVDLTGYLPEKYSTKGDIDYTSYLQKGIDENKQVLIPNFPVLINSQGLNIPSERKIYFQKKSRLILKSSNTRSYAMLNIDRAKNIEIINPDLKGERTETFNGVKRTGEWGMGISIHSSENISISGGVLNTFWGDGIYLGKNNNTPKITNSNIQIKNVKIENARRNGISVITAKDLVIENVVIKNTSGTSPEAAVDIEPNGRNDIIQNVLIKNLETKNNRYGFLISLRKLVDTKKQFISVLVENHKDNGSIQAFRYAGFNNAYKENNLVKIDGEIIVRNSLWQNNQGTITYEEGEGLLPNLTFEGAVYKGVSKGKKVTYDYKRWQYITKHQSNILFKDK